MGKTKTRSKPAVKKKTASGKAKAAVTSKTKATATSKTKTKAKVASARKDAVKPKKKAAAKKVSMNGKAVSKKKSAAPVSKIKSKVKSKAKSKAKVLSTKKDSSKPKKKISAKKINMNGKAAAGKKTKSSNKGKTKYSAKDLKYFKQIILDERKQILESAKANMEALVDHESGEYVGDNSTYSTHMAEQGTDEMEREKNYLFVQRDEKYLGYLNEALIRIDNGTYGICINCKKLIMKERLELVPITQHCIVCKTMKG
jgi:DnaK suppressor protein